MSRLRLPPRVKILEALGAVADGRVKPINERRAVVISSEGDREYLVVVEGGRAYSNDNGTKFRGYIGYPIIAFLMVLGRIPYDERVADALKRIRWRELNERYKRYSVVEAVVKRIARDRGVGEDVIDELIDRVNKELEKFRLEYDASLEHVAKG